MMWFNWKQSVFLIFGACICTISGQTLYEGSICTHHGQAGICEVITKCASILAEVISKRLSYDQMVSCGFKGKDPIVCCPGDVSDRFDTGTSSTTEEIFTFDSGRTTTSSSTTPRSVTRTEVGVRAREACERYSKDAPAPLGFQILGGIPASPGEFPHMAAFGYRDVNGVAWNCAGSLISERYILTAAHCVARESNLPQIIRLGKTSLDTDEDAAESVDISLERIILHPNYVPSQNYHDIALIRLSRDAPLGSFIRPACLYTDEKDNAATIPLVATGWGTVNPETRDKSNVLLKVNLTIVELSSCNQTHVSIGLDRRLRNGLNRGQMCAFMNNKDTCEGDSGGPLQVMDQYSISTIVGITSFGLSCGSNVPSVYARVAFYMEWIENTVWPF